VDGLESHGEWQIFLVIIEDCGRYARAPGTKKNVNFVNACRTSLERVTSASIPSSLFERTGFPVAPMAGVTLVIRSRPLGDFNAASGKFSATEWGRARAF